MMVIDQKLDQGPTDIRQHSEYGVSEVDHNLDGLAN